MTATSPPQKDYSQLNTTEPLYGFRVPDIEATNFELKPGLINLVERNQFSGSPAEDPILHISNFLLYCSTVKQFNVSQDHIRMTLFPFSLKDNARLWLNTLNMTDINTWDALVLAFYHKYYPQERTAYFRRQIINFSQEPDEMLHEAWDRYKELQRLCPHHGLDKWLVVQIFYRGLDNESQMILDSAANGRFMNEQVDAGFNLIEEMSIYNARFHNRRESAEKKSKHELDSVSILDAKLAAISQKLDDMLVSSSVENVNTFQPYQQNIPFNHQYLSHSQNRLMEFQKERDPMKQIETQSAQLATSYAQRQPHPPPDNAAIMSALGRLETQIGQLLTNQEQIKLQIGYQKPIEMRFDDGPIKMWFDDEVDVVI